MLRCLANCGYVYEDFGNSVVLTPEGKAAVAKIFSTFSEVYTFFHRFLRLSQDEAHSQAIRLISEFPQDTYERLRAVVRKTLKKNK